MCLSDETFNNMISNNSNINGIPISHFLYAISKYFEDNKIDNFGNNTMKVNDYEIVRYTAPIQSIGSEMYREIIDRNICLKYDNGSKWAEMPYLWTPYEKEVYGSNPCATDAYESHMTQYH